MWNDCLEDDNFNYDFLYFNIITSSENLIAQMRRPNGLCKLIKNLEFLTAMPSCYTKHLELFFRNGFCIEFILDARIEIEFWQTVEHKIKIFQTLKLIFSKNGILGNLHNPLGCHRCHFSEFYRKLKDWFFFFEIIFWNVQYFVLVP